MAKNNKNAAKEQQVKNLAQKEQKKENKAPKTPGKAPETPQVETVTPKTAPTKETVATQVMTNPDKFAKKVRTLSPDAQVMALNLVHKTMVEPQDPALQFPTEVKKVANNIVAIGSLCALAEHSANGDDSFALIMQKTGYSGIIEAAKALGYTLPDIKALPVLEDGRVQLPANAVEIPEEKKQEILKEQAERNAEAPELDPTKITSEEDLRKALRYKFLDRKYKLVDTLLDGIDFMKQFRLHEAEMAENAEEAKAKFNSRNSGDWLDDLFQYVKPTVFFAGIGKGMASVTAIEKNPIHAFVIFRNAIKDRETNEPVMSDQEIAYCVKSIVKWHCHNNIESNKKAIEGLDAKKNANEIELCKKQIANYEQILDYISSPNAEEAETLLQKIGNKFDEGGTLTQECQEANKTFNSICACYYNKNLSTTDYKNLDVNVQQYAYHIINLFRAPGEQIPDVGTMNISELEERTAEEKEELTKKAKKEWAEKKKEAEKNA